MYPPIFNLVKNYGPATAIFGNNPVRFYPFGEAPQSVQTPYAVWQGLYGTPENYINQRPDIDSFGTQIDVYADTASGARAAAKEVRDALEGQAYVVAWRGESIDSDTKRFRYSFDVEFLTPR